MEYILAYSGGKESTYMLDHVLRNNLPLDRVVFADTYLEYPQTYDFLEQVEKYYMIQLERLEPKDTFDDWFYGTVTRGANKGLLRGMPLVVFSCYWCREAKVKPIEALEGKGKKKNKVYIGYTASESHRIQVKDNLIYPLIENGVDEVTTRSHLQKIGLLSSLYEHFDRSGCWLCPKQSKKSLYSLYKLFPEKWEKLKVYEADQGRPFKLGMSLSTLEAEFTLKDKKVDFFQFESNPYQRIIRKRKEKVNADLKVEQIKLFK